MTIAIVDNLITSEDIAEIFNTTENNVRKTYIHNPKKQDKLEVICLGVICKKNKITHIDLTKLIKKVKNARRK